MHDPNIWTDQSNAKKITKEISSVKNQLEKDRKLETMKDDLLTYILLLQEDFNENLFSEALTLYKKENEFIQQLEIEILLSGKYDFNNAYMTIHPGAGGTESQDWAEMLLRMYRYWAENSGFGFKIIDYLDGEVAGLKSATIEISGDFVYGYLKSEAGIHRLVRISPFNAQGKRQTSFVSIFVYPALDDEIEVEINQSDLRIDTYRASSAGGQHVNTTDSAVRITHIPTNIVVQCQNERSQIQNREKAMNFLRAKLYMYYENQREKEREKHEASKTEIGWGNQIRSYVFHPYQMVKDHRTNFETGQISNVMNGELNGFINAYLKKCCVKD
jgi:peptide chain release factor 2